MKLRNKKTGEIKSIEEIIRDAFLSNELDSLKNIDANWEDVDGTNDTNTPLIKDEKIRKAVRAWAEANNYEAVRCGYYNRGCVMFSLGVASIVFMDFYEKIEAGITYTIEELCGEEE